MRRRGALRAALGLTVIAACVVLAGAGAWARDRPAPRSATPARFTQARVLLEHGSIDGVFPDGKDLFVAARLGVAPDDTLLLLSSVHGRVLARHRLAGRVDGLMWINDFVWAITTGRGSSPSPRLWLLDPSTLAVHSETILPPPGSATTSRQPIAVAGVRTWLADGNRLLSADINTGKVTGQRRIAGATQLNLASDWSDRTLFVAASEGSGHGWVHAYDPRAHAITARSARLATADAPEIGGLSERGLWITTTSGTHAMARELSPSTLRRLRVEPPFANRVRTLGLTIHVDQDMLFVNDRSGDPRANYCGNASSGRSRLALPQAARRGRFLAADAERIYYLGTPRRHDQPRPLMTAHIPDACR